MYVFLRRCGFMWYAVSERSGSMGKHSGRWELRRGPPVLSWVGMIALAGAIAWPSMAAGQSGFGEEGSGTASAPEQATGRLTQEEQRQLRAEQWRTRGLAPPWVAPTASAPAAAATPPVAAAAPAAEAA